MLSNKWRKLLVGDLSWQRIMISLLEVYVVLLVFAWFFSDRLIFQPQPSSYREGGDFHRIPMPNGEKIGLLSLPNPGAFFSILHCHGNAEDLGDIQPVMETFRSLGFSIYALDYRGYGISDGKAGCDNACEDGEAALRYLVNHLGIPLDHIIIHGRSVGAGIALHLAAGNKVGGLILESPFLTAFRVRTFIPIAPFDKLRNNRRIREISCPLLVMHGEADGVIPTWHGRKLYDLASVPKQCWWVPHAGHNDIVMTDAQGYWSHIRAFRDWVATMGGKQ